MKLLGSHLLKAAEVTRVAAGGALAVDRDAFSAAVTEMVKSQPNITLHTGEVTAIDENRLTLVATGPLTEGALAGEITRLTGGDKLSFYDAAAPIHRRKSGHEQGVRRQPLRPGRCGLPELPL